MHNVMLQFQTIMRKSVSPEHNDLWISQNVMYKKITVKFEFGAIYVLQKA